MQKNGIKVISLLALILMISLIVFLPSDIAFAVVPQNYVSDVINKDLEWWSADEYLGLATLKRTVESWKQNGAYDFTYLKEHPIIVAVIDTGIDLEHELFLGKYGENGKPQAGAVDNNGVGKYDVLLRDKNGTPIVCNTVKGYDRNNVTDIEGRRHGTHVCGIVATLIHKLDLEQYIKILPIRASVDVAGNFESEDVEAGIKFAIEKGAHVINMSLSSNSDTFANIKNSTYHKNAILVAAAGNDGAHYKRYPAALPNVIGVMNYMRSDKGIVLGEKSNYGNYGSWVIGGQNIGYDLCAPGTDIYSARGKENVPFVPKDDNDSEYYKSLTGTSMASPIVAFGAALITLKYQAMAGDNHAPKAADELAALVRNASTSTLTKGSDKYKIFDINALVGIAWHEATIEINDSALEKQHLGSLQRVKYKLNVLPNTEEEKGTVQWFANDVKFGEGFTVEYIPSSEIGTIEIKAVWKHTDKVNDTEIVVVSFAQIEIDYMLITADSVSDFELSAAVDDVKLSDLSACNIGEEYHFQIDNLKHMSDEDKNRLQWFVNDKIAHIGAEFDFVPKESGTYSIRVEINDFSSNPIVLKVLAPSVEDDEHRRELKICTIVLASVIAAIVLSAAVVLIVKYVKKKRNV